MRVATLHYTLHAKQREFLAAPMPKMFVGGIGAGKTRAGLYQILMMPEDTLGAVIAPTYPMLMDVIWREAVTTLPIKETNHSRLSLKLPGNREVIFRSATHPDRLRGLNLDYLWIDEACYVDEQVYLTALGRLRHQPDWYWLTTTPRRPSWVYDRIIAAETKVHVVTCPTWCNPYISEDYARALLAQYGSLLGRRELGAEWVSVDGHIFRQEWIRYADELHAKSGTYTVMGVDLASSLKEQADYTAYVVVAYNLYERRWQVDAVGMGRWTFQGQVQYIRQAAEAHQVRIIAVESNQYQQVFAQELARLGYYVRPIQARQKKEQRILSLAPLYEMGLITHARRHTELESQLINYPHGAHDDLLDALVYAVQVAETGVGATGIQRARVDHRPSL